MKRNVSPAVVIAIVVVLLGGLGFVVWKGLTGKNDGAPVVVKPQSPIETTPKNQQVQGSGL